MGTPLDQSGGFLMKRPIAEPISRFRTVEFSRLHQWKHSFPLNRLGYYY